jgi:hypothetical protein
MVVFNEIVKLRVGEALLFAPGAIVGVGEEEKEGGGGNGKGEREVRRLGTGYLKIKVRARLTEDGGKSVMAH